MMPGVIHWCEMCANAPSDGVLEVIYEGQVEVDYMQACQACVEGLNDDEWI